MKYLCKGIIFLSLLSICNGELQAQPFIYQKTQDTSYNQDGFTFVRAHKIDLTNNSIEEVPFYTDFAYDTDNTQTWLLNGAISWRDLPLEYSVDNIKNKKTHFNFYDFVPVYAVYSIKSNKIFLTGTNRKSSIFAVMNSISGDEDFRLTKYHFNCEGMFLSKDESKLYISYEDTTENICDGNKIKIATMSTSTYKITNIKNLHDLGYPGAIGYSLSNGKMGKAIIASGFTDGREYFKIYDFENDSSSTYFPLVGTSEAYFTNNGKYIIIEVQSDSVADEGIQVHYHTSTGLFKIYNVGNQKLVKSIQLPPKREVYTFDRFPNNIYYYNEKTERAIILNIDSLVKAPSGATDTPKIIMYNLGNTFFTVDFINGKVKYELGNGYTVIKSMPAEGDKLIYNEYDEKNNLLGVFSFEKGYIKGTYTRDKNKKVSSFSRIDIEP